MRPLVAAVLVLAALAAAPAAVAAPPPVASFAVAPEAPHSGEAVTFTSTSTGTVSEASWDLDGDGRCDDAAGATAQRSFPVPATYLVQLCVSGPGGDATQLRRVEVSDLPPDASFVYLPQDIRAGDPVTLVSTSTDPDSAMTSFDWDLDGDGTFGDARGNAIPWTFLEPGKVIVGLQVTDAFGLTSVTLRSLRVAPAPLEPMSPFPVVRLSGVSTLTGMLVTRLAVTAPRGAWIDVRCRGRERGCRFRRVVRRSKGGPWQVRQARGGLTEGAVITVRVRRSGQLGKYTRIVIAGAGEPPERVDRCLAPSPARPGRCP